MNIDFRFGVEQGEKIRAIDDLKQSLTNLAFSVLTPIRLVSWGHVAELFRRASSSHFGWEFFKSGRESAYMQLPLDEKHTARDAIALKSPKNKNGMVSSAAPWSLGR